MSFERTFLRKDPPETPVGPVPTHRTVGEVIAVIPDPTVTSASTYRQIVMEAYFILANGMFVRIGGSESCAAIAHAVWEKYKNVDWQAVICAEINRAKANGTLLPKAHATNLRLVDICFAFADKSIAERNRLFGVTLGLMSIVEDYAFQLHRQEIAAQAEQIGKLYDECMDQQRQIWQKYREQTQAFEELQRLPKASILAAYKHSCRTKGL